MTSGGTCSMYWRVHGLFAVGRHEDLHGFVVIADGAGYRENASHGDTALATAAEAGAAVAAALTTKPTRA